MEEIGVGAQAALDVAEIEGSLVPCLFPLPHFCGPPVALFPCNNLRLTHCMQPYAPESDTLHATLMHLPPQECSAKGKTSEALTKLLHLMPETATVNDVGCVILVQAPTWKGALSGTAPGLSIARAGLRSVAARGPRPEGGKGTWHVCRLHKGHVLKVLPGGKIPMDGVVVAGGAYLNESMVTGNGKGWWQEGLARKSPWSQAVVQLLGVWMGVAVGGESLPVWKGVGAPVIGGTISTGATLLVGVRCCCCGSAVGVDVAQCLCDIRW
eukprot:1139137-Pelagomonas_calceolata.AAC.1